MSSSCKNGVRVHGVADIELALSDPGVQQRHGVAYLGIGMPHFLCVILCTRRGKLLSLRSSR